MQGFVTKIEKSRREAIDERAKKMVELDNEQEKKFTDLHNQQKKEGDGRKYRLGSEVVGHEGMVLGVRCQVSGAAMPNRAF